MFYSKTSVYLRFISRGIVREQLANRKYGPCIARFGIDYEHVF